MKAIAVSDAFITEAYYREAFARYPGIALLCVPFFGLPDRQSMREVIHTIERGGPNALPPPPELEQCIAEAEILMVHLCPVPRSLLEKAPKLRYILTNRGGTENVDIEAASELGITVLSNPAHNANAVAEYTVALMLAESRNIARADRAMHSATWREVYPNSGQIFELRGSTVGLIGFGTIARLVAKKLSCFECSTLVYDPFLADNDPDLESYHCKMVSLDTLLQSADIVSLHARCSCEKPMLDVRELELMKPTAYFINTARPHLVNNRHLYELLRSGRLMGAGLDVFLDEPIRPDDPLLTLDNVTLTNHRGGDTVNAYSDSPAMLLAELSTLKNGGSPHFWVNRTKLQR